MEGALRAGGQKDELFCLSWNHVFQKWCEAHREYFYKTFFHVTGMIIIRTYNQSRISK